ncbi:hypothetical protein PybrP1_000096 [[Pythium] brassicae (nom. inval.)]|nr:hypothetical protein PybrP1_000096 [[Pythium] brassicae (nom. inval.)]
MHPPPPQTPTARITSLEVTLSPAPSRAQTASASAATRIRARRRRSAHSVPRAPSPHLAAASARESFCRSRRRARKAAAATRPPQTLRQLRPTRTARCISPHLAAASASECCGRHRCRTGPSRCIRATAASQVCTSSPVCSAMENQQHARRRYRLKNAHRPDVWHFARLQEAPGHHAIPDSELKSKHTECAVCLLTRRGWQPQAAESGRSPAARSRQDLGSLDCSERTSSGARRRQRIREYIGYITSNCANIELTVPRRQQLHEMVVVLASKARVALKKKL